MEDREPDLRVGCGAQCLVVPVGGEMDVDRAPMLPGAHPEVDWAQLRTVGKGRRSPLARLQAQLARAPRPGPDGRHLFPSAIAR
ncbi:hypothetical protein [Streptomyces goshikiensis]|uniref:hypothetical protein n=1 Tax=Streptomyces goshikiensis TaxID=1942 RepID=UPI0036693455